MYTLQQAQRVQIQYQYGVRGPKTDMVWYLGPNSSTILYYTILYYTILYYTILYNTIPYNTTQYYTILYYTILYYTILYYTILYYTILYYSMLYYTVFYYCGILEAFRTCEVSSNLQLGTMSQTEAGRLVKLYHLRLLQDLQQGR